MHQIKLYNAVPTQDEGALRQAVIQSYGRFWAETVSATGQ
jgi:hypothetical protein